MSISALTSDATVLAELGERLSRTRLERNLSQQQLATEAGISKRTLERIEAGAPANVAAFIRVLRVLGLLDRLDSVVPEPLPSPIEQLKLHGRRRQRAGSPRTHGDGDAEAGEPSPWTWGTPPAPERP